MQKKRRKPLLLILILGAFALLFKTQIQQSTIALTQRLHGKHSIMDRIEQYGPEVKNRLKPAFEKIDAIYPPKQITLIGLKLEKRLEVWINEPPQLLKSYPILAASGQLGPKLQEGDRQVPEGLYLIEDLNPNSRYHLALRVNYPNQFDKEKGQLDGRKNLGCDIMIHGKSCSVGCLAMGDQAAEELFVLAAETGIDNLSLILSPVDFRKRDLPHDATNTPQWTPDLYRRIEAELTQRYNPTKILQ